MNAARRGILLAGGSGTRLHPCTQVVSKHLLPVYDKPMVHYPLATLMQAGIREVLLISTPLDVPQYRRLLGDGRQWGLAIEYAMQPKPGGIAQALLIASDFLQGEGCALILGDNLFAGPGLPEVLQAANARRQGATVFAHPVSDPERYGVVQVDARGQPLALVEKPAAWVSNLAVTGLYFYDAQAVGFARALQPSARGELEITDVNAAYLAHGALRVQMLGTDCTWLDAGTHDALLEAGVWVAGAQKQLGQKIGCPQSVARQMGWVNWPQSG